MVFNAIKNSAIDIWEEMLYLMIFNLIWLIGSFLIIPWPFLTFGLFAIVHDIGQGKGIKFGKFFQYGRQMWKPAYIWGGINLGVALVLWINIGFYAGIDSQWALIVRVILMALAIIWIVLQLVALPIYPRLAEPSFKLALRNAAIVVSRYPLSILILLIIVAVLLTISSIFPAIAFLGGFAFIAVVTNRIVGAIVEELVKENTGAA
jgi:uncharacterized membrane protein YesL